MPWSNELAQLPTPMRATRTLPFDSDIGASVKLLSDVQDALQDCDPGRRREHDDRPLERAPGSEHEARGDDDDALGPGAEADVAAQAERLGRASGRGACPGSRTGRGRLQRGRARPPSR